MALLTTLLAIAGSMSLYLVISSLLWDVQFRGLITSTLIPLFVAPPLAFLFFKMTSQLMEVEAALRESETRYRQVFEQVRDTIYLTTLDGRIIDVNPASSAIFGYSRDELRRLNVAEHYRDPAELLIETELVEKDGFFRDHEIVLKHKDGRGIVCLNTAAAWRNEFGEIVGYIGTLHDVTDRKKVDEELKRLRNLLGSIVDSMPSVLIGVDPEGRVTRWNRQAVMETGLAPEQAIGRPLAALVSEPAGLSELTGRAMKEGTPQYLRNVTRQGSAETKYCDVTVYPLVSEDIDGAVIRIDDATARVRMEEVIIQTEKMLSLGGLAAGMAHEINNPLVGIIQGAQNVLRRLSPDLEANLVQAREIGVDLEKMRQYIERRHIRQFLNGIVSSGQRAARIVSNMLDFSRRGDSEMRSVLLEDLLEKAVELSSSEYDLKKHYDFLHLNIERDYTCGLPPVWCEPTSIEQVILNLLKNAAQALNEKTYRDERPCITLRTGREGEFAYFEVADNGPGMDEETRRRVFEPFYTTKPSGLGTGLGLSVSYFIVTDTHGGALNVESKPGQGAKFKVRLPLAADSTSSSAVS